MKFPRQPDKIGGWTIDYKFLEALKLHIIKEEPSDYRPCLEEIERVLLALESMMPLPEVPHA